MNPDEQRAIARQIGQKIQECRELVEKLEGGDGVRAKLDKVLKSVCNWVENDAEKSSQ